MHILYIVPIINTVETKDKYNYITENLLMQIL